MNNEIKLPDNHITLKTPTLQEAIAQLCNDVYMKPFDKKTTLLQIDDRINLLNKVHEEEIKEIGEKACYSKFIENASELIYFIDNEQESLVVRIGFKLTKDVSFHNNEDAALVSIKAYKNNLYYIL